MAQSLLFNPRQLSNDYQTSRNSDGHLKDKVIRGGQGGRRMETSSIRNRIGTSVFTRQVDNSVFGKKVGFFGKLFGCWHEDISRPFSYKNTAYRVCLKCGARKQFDSETLKTFGAFYFPPIIEADETV